MVVVITLFRLSNLRGLIIVTLEGVTRIPWFSYRLVPPILQRKPISLSATLVGNFLALRSPFHAAMGILTTRMLLNIRKTVATDVMFSDSQHANGSTKRALDNRRRHRVRDTMETWHGATVPSSY